MCASTPAGAILLENLSAITTLVTAIHPSIARSIALAACRAADPEATARQYLRNYEAVVRFVQRTRPRVAQAVALQTCRSNNPMRWAKRILANRRRTAADPSSDD